MWKNSFRSLMLRITFIANFTLLWPDFKFFFAFWRIACRENDIFHFIFLIIVFDDVIWSTLYLDVWQVNFFSKKFVQVFKGCNDSNYERLNKHLFNLVSGSYFYKMYKKYIHNLDIKDVCYNTIYRCMVFTIVILLVSK